MRWEVLHDDYNHVCNANFREMPMHDGLPKDHRLFDALDRYEKDERVVTNIEAQTLLRATYQTTMGIFDHTQEDVSPIALFLVHPNEDTARTGRRYRRMIQYEESKVLANFGVSWVEFEKLTLPHAEMPMTASRERSLFNVKNQQLGLEATHTGLMTEKK